MKLRLMDMEMSQRFLGSTSDVTLLEADAILMGLIWSPVGSSRVTQSGSRDTVVAEDVANSSK